MYLTKFCAATFISLLLCPMVPSAQEVIKSCDFGGPGDACVFDLEATGSDLLSVDTKASSANELWRATLVKANEAGAKSNVGSGSITDFTGEVRQRVRLGSALVVFVNYEGPLPGVFPTSVTVRFTGPVTVSDSRPVTVVAPCSDEIGDTPLTAHLLGSVSGDTGSDVLTFASSICPDDEDFFLVSITEDSASGFPVELSARFTLTQNPVPAGSSGDLFLCVLVEAEPLEECQAAGAIPPIAVRITDTVGDDGKNVRVRIVGAGPIDTNNYTLQVQGHVP